MGVSAANTTYYFRVGSLNWDGGVNFAAAFTTCTLAAAPSTATPHFSGVWPSSVTF